MTLQQNEQQAQHSQPEPPQQGKAPQAEQWRWFGITALGLVIGGILGLLLNWGLAVLLPANDFFKADYRSGLSIAIFMGVYGAVLALFRRYWLPAAAFFVLGITFYPLLWRLAYTLLF